MCEPTKGEIMTLQRSVALFVFLFIGVLLTSCGGGGQMGTPSNQVTSLEVRPSQVTLRNNSSLGIFEGIQLQAVGTTSSGTQVFTNAQWTSSNACIPVDSTAGPSNGNTGCNRGCNFQTNVGGAMTATITATV